MGRLAWPVWAMKARAATPLGLRLAEGGGGQRPDIGHRRRLHINIFYQPINCVARDSSDGAA